MLLLHEYLWIDVVFYGIRLKLKFTSRTTVLWAATIEFNRMNANIVQGANTPMDARQTTTQKNKKNTLHLYWDFQGKNMRKLWCHALNEKWTHAFGNITNKLNSEDKTDDTDAKKSIYMHTLHESRREWNKLEQKEAEAEKKRKRKVMWNGCRRIHAIYHFLPQSLEFNFPAQ